MSDDAKNFPVLSVDEILAWLYGPSAGEQADRGVAARLARATEVVNALGTDDPVTAALIKADSVLYTAMHDRLKALTDALGTDDVEDVRRMRAWFGYADVHRLQAEWRTFRVPLRQKPGLPLGLGLLEIRALRPGPILSVHHWCWWSRKHNTMRHAREVALTARLMRAATGAVSVRSFCAASSNKPKRSLFRVRRVHA